jgi:hypothetical protein
MSKPAPAAPSGAFLQNYGVELLYESAPKMTQAEVLEALKQRAVHKLDVVILWSFWCWGKAGRYPQATTCDYPDREGFR